MFEHKFNANVGGQDISPDGIEVIVTTCNPDNSIYLFNIEDNKLVKKIKNNTSQKPLTTFSFNEIRNLI
jgi:WD40 repeat protein